MTLTAIFASEKRQQQLNARRSSNAAGGRNGGLWVRLDSLGNLGRRDANNENGEEHNDWSLGDFGGGSKLASELWREDDGVCEFGVGREARFEFEAGDEEHKSTSSTA
jgi:hypothetical protein